MTDVGGNGWIPPAPGKSVADVSNAESNPHVAKYGPTPISNAPNNLDEKNAQVLGDQ